MIGPKRIAISINLFRLSAMGMRSPARAHHKGVYPVRCMAIGAASHGTRSGQRQRRAVVSATTWSAADPAGVITVRDLATRDCTVDAELTTTVRSASSVPRPELAPPRRSCILLAVAGRHRPLLHPLKRPSAACISRHGDWRKNDFCVVTHILQRYLQGIYKHTAPLAA